MSNYLVINVKKNEDVEIGRIVVEVVLIGDTNTNDDDEGTRWIIHEKKKKIEKCAKEKERNNEEHHMNAWA